MKEFLVHSDHGKVNDEQFANFECTHSIKLPNSFKTFIEKHDAPWLDENHFKFKNKFFSTNEWRYKIFDGIDSRDLNFLGFNDSVCEGEGITERQDFDVFGHDKIIAFGISANGDYICFDYRHAPSTNEPYVVVMFHDAYDEENKMLLCHVADSFEEFMNLLYKAE